MKIEWLDDIAIADVAFRINAGNLEELFETAAYALFESMIDPRTIENKISRKVELKGDTDEELLFDWLSELIYLKDAVPAVFKDFKVRIEQKGEVLRLRAELSGDEIKPEKYDIHVDVKAVTMHEFKLEKTDEGWSAVVVLDV